VRAKNLSVDQMVAADYDCVHSLGRLEAARDFAALPWLPDNSGTSVGGFYVF
jgi:hypothetical protein